jgi:hypothetical protein
MKPTKFWMIIKDSNSTATKKHLSLKEAEQEAIRLAALYVGEIFHILQSVEYAYIPVPDVELSRDYETLTE